MSKGVSVGVTCSARVEEHRGTATTQYLTGLMVKGLPHLVLSRTSPFFLSAEALETWSHRHSGALVRDPSVSDVPDS